METTAPTSKEPVTDWRSTAALILAFMALISALPAAGSAIFIAYVILEHVWLPRFAPVPVMCVAFLSSPCSVLLGIVALVVGWRRKKVVMIIVAVALLLAVSPFVVGITGEYLNRSQPPPTVQSLAGEYRLVAGSDQELGITSAQAAAALIVIKSNGEFQWKNVPAHWRAWPTSPTTPPTEFDSGVGSIKIRHDSPNQTTVEFSFHNTDFADLTFGKLGDRFNSVNADILKMYGKHDLV